VQEMLWGEVWPNIGVKDVLAEDFWEIVGISIPKLIQFNSIQNSKSVKKKGEIPEEITIPAF
jgi:hypothetical protein